MAIVWSNLVMLTIYVDWYIRVDDVHCEQGAFLSKKMTWDGDSTRVCAHPSSATTNKNVIIDLLSNKILVA